MKRLRPPRRFRTIGGLRGPGRGLLALTGALALVAVLGGVACGRSPTVSGSEILGSWGWVRATGGIAGQEITPSTEGYALELRFLTGGVVELYRDSELQTRTSYQILSPSSESEPYRRVSYAEPVLGADEQYLVEASTDRLILRDPCCDRYEWEFRPQA